MPGLACALRYSIDAAAPNFLDSYDAIDREVRSRPRDERFYHGTDIMSICVAAKP